MATNCDTYTCPNCVETGLIGGDIIIPVWEDPPDADAGENPDYVGCTNCQTMVEYNAACDGYRPPRSDLAHMRPSANLDGLERRVCPNCRLYFDVGEDREDVFCSDACERRHQNGVLVADGGENPPTPADLDALEDGDVVEVDTADGTTVTLTVEDPRHPNLGGRAGNGRYSRYFTRDDGKRVSLCSYHEGKNDERRHDATYLINRTKTSGIMDNIDVERTEVVDWRRPAADGCQPAESDREAERSPLPDAGVAATGYVCQNFPEHPGEEPEMVSSGPGEGGVICPECGRMAAGPGDEIPYGDPPDYATDGGTDQAGREGPHSRRLGPHYVPTIDCGKCGHEHHIDAATGEYQGSCSECWAFLRRPTDAEERQFYDFMDWKARHQERGVDYGGEAVAE